MFVEPIKKTKVKKKIKLHNFFKINLYFYWANNISREIENEFITTFIWDSTYHEGPDYASGYGLVNALAGVGITRERNFREGAIVTPDQIDPYPIHVPVNTSELRFTLVWDDEASDLRLSPDARHLVNDLELRLVAPSGRNFGPWVLDPLPRASTIGDLDPITLADIRPAFRGEDHLNNVEQVFVPLPEPGLWRLNVSVGDQFISALSTPQSYTVAGDFRSHFFFTDWSEQPGLVYEIDGGRDLPFFTAPSGDFRIYHSAFDRLGNMYYTDANRTQIWQWDGSSSTLIFTHTTFIRDIGFDSVDILYFSEATGASADGRIYRFMGPGQGAVPHVEVPLSEVDGFWAGDFAFAPDDELFISSGNRIPSFVYKNAGGNNWDQVAGASTLIAGIVFDNQGDLFFSAWDEHGGYIYWLDLATGRSSKVHHFPERRIWDVSFRR